MSAGIERAGRLRRVAVIPAGAGKQAIACRLAARLGIRRPVALLESALVDVPSVVGWFRPVILAPASALSGLTPPQLEMILAHELAHIRRRDPLVNLLQTGIEAALFYHPAAWWISSRIRQEREHCCDEAAVALCGDPVGYARSLARLERLRQEWPALAVSSTGGSLLERVRRLVYSAPAPGGAPRFAAAALLAMALLVVAPIESARATHWLKQSAGLPARANGPSAVRAAAFLIEKPGRAAARPRRVEIPVSQARRPRPALLETVFSEAQAPLNSVEPVSAWLRKDWTLWPGR
jgi:beta-lactamase regulating signal transducer with metallopeptidase domain